MPIFWGRSRTLPSAAEALGPSVRYNASLMPSPALTDRAKTVAGRGGSASDAGARPERSRDLLRRGLELMVLVGFGIAQPAFDVISKTPEFFALRESSRMEVILFALVIGVGVPAALLTLELVANVAGHSAARGLHFVFLALLTALIAIPLVQFLAEEAFEVVDRTPSGWFALGGATLLGVAAAVAHARFRLVRTYLLALAPAPLIFLALFLVDAPLGRAVLPPVPPVAKPAPVVMLVFDEFPIASLMDERQQIDAKRYPNFAALARDSTWYRRTTTVSDITTSAVPAILTGSLPPSTTPPTASEQPRNLFALLRKSHRVRASETFTSMCPAGSCGGPGLSALPRRTLALVGDGIEVGAHAAAPRDLEPRLGELGEGVKLGDPTTSFQRLIGNLRRTDRPELHYAHVLLPHYPWIRLPSGRFYERAAALDLPRGFQAGAVQRWDSDPWLVREGWQRHLLQVAYLDRLLGGLLRRLRAIGTYDRTLVVALADHGVSFAPGEQMRDVTPRNVQDVAFVPLFIKAPGQRRGAVIDEPARTTDVLPTIMQTLAGRIPWRIEGRSLSGRHPGPRPPVTFTSSRNPAVTTSARALDRRFRAALKRRIRMFGTGSDGADLVNREHHPEWIGRRIGDREVRLSQRAAVRIEGRGELRRVSRASAFVPVLLRGQVRGRVRSGRDLALTVNGRVAAVVPVNPWWRGPPTFSAILPEHLLQEDGNSIKAFWAR